MSEAVSSGSTGEWVRAATARWVDAGLISRDQGQRIVAYERQTSQQGMAEPLATTSAGSTAPRTGRGIDLGSVIMYLGAFLILFALTIFVGAAWDGMSRGAQFGWAVAAVVGLGGLGVWLRSALKAVTAGNLLIFAATGAIPLLVYTFQRLVGWWPERSDLTYDAFYDRILAVWIGMELVSILVAIGVMVWIRFPLVMLLVGFWCWFLSMDLVRWVTGDEKWEWNEASRWLGAAMGLLMVAVAILLHRRRLGAYGMWLALFGHVTWIGSLGSLALGDEIALARLLFPLLAVTTFVISAWLQARVHLVFGAIALYSWVTYIVFDVLGTGLGVTLGLVIVGIVILVTGVMYQRLVEPWLAARFGHAR